MSVFLTQNKTRPGVYMNFESMSQNLGSVCERGIVVLPLELDFLESEKIIKTNVYTNFLSTFGISINHSSMICVREALKNAETVLIYRLNSGNTASASVSELNIFAKHSGSYGNSISVTITMQDELYQVSSYIDGQIYETKSVAYIDEFSSNLIELTGSLTTTENISLTGGTSSSASEAEYSDFYNTLITQEFNTFAITSDSSSIKSQAVSMTKAMRDGQSKKIQCVVSNYPQADFEGVISVTNGVVLEDNTNVPANIATCYVAGAVAGCQINESLTYSSYMGAIDVSPRFDDATICEKLVNGEFLFTFKRNKAIIEQDINSFTGFSPTKSKVFAKNRVVRVIDNIATDIRTLFEDYYLGKVSNNSTGRSLFAGECIRYLRTLEDIDCIENFDPLADISVIAGDDLDSIVVNLNILPVDSIEKLYMTVTLT